MRHHKHLIAIVTVGWTALVAAQTDPVPGALAALASTSAPARVTAFYGFLSLGESPPGKGAFKKSIKQRLSSILSAHPGDREIIVQALNALLTAEDALYWTAPDTSLPVAGVDGFDDYYADVVTAVVALNDPRSINALVPAVLNGTMVQSRLAGFGAPAIDPLIPYLYSPWLSAKESVAVTFMMMLGPPAFISSSDQLSQSKIRAGLRFVAATTEVSFLPPIINEAAALLPPTPPGDLDGDGVADCKDIALIRAAWHTRVGDPRFDIRADLNGDGVVNRLDLKAERELLPKHLDCEPDDHDREERGDPQGHKRD